MVAIERRRMEPQPYGILWHVSPDDHPVNSRWWLKSTCNSVLVDVPKDMSNARPVKLDSGWYWEVEKDA